MSHYHQVSQDNIGDKGPHPPRPRRHSQQKPSQQVSVPAGLIPNGPFLDSILSLVHSLYFPSKATGCFCSVYGRPASPELFYDLAPECSLLGSELRWLPWISQSLQFPSHRAGSLRPGQGLAHGALFFCFLISVVTWGSLYQNSQG